METIDFLELKDQIELQLKNNFSFELLELQYAPYAFGNGMIAYRIKGRVVKIIYDGKDNQIELMVSAYHVKYDRAELTTVFSGLPTDFINNGIAALKNNFK